MHILEKLQKLSYKIYVKSRYKIIMNVIIKTTYNDAVTNNASKSKTERVIKWQF